MSWRVLGLPGPLSVRSCLGSHGYQDTLVSEVGAYGGLWKALGVRWLWVGVKGSSSKGPE